jgi:transposase
MMALEGNVDGQAFEIFAQQFLVPQLRRGDIVIWDRLPAHKMESVRAIIESSGAKVILLPPYSPDLNPIELMWSKLKQIIRGFAPKTIRAFHKALKKALSTITSSDLHGWFRHCGCLGQNAWSALYSQEERARGSTADEVASDLQVFRELNLAERLKGIDPILAERQRGLHLIIAVPLAMLGGVIATGALADMGLGALPSVGAGVVVALLLHQLSASLTVGLARRRGT